MLSKALLWMVCALSGTLAQAATEQHFDPDFNDDATAVVAPVAAEITKPVSHVAAPPPLSNPAAPYVEKGPMDLQAYIEKNLQPQYLRVNTKGYNVCKENIPSTTCPESLDFISSPGDLFVIEGKPIPGAHGASVQIHVGNELRWIYVPYDPKSDFQFCESTACFEALSEALDFFLHGTNVSVSDAKACGVTAGPEGIILPMAAAKPKIEPATSLPDSQISLPQKKPGVFSAKVKPLWEKQLGAKGKNWTNLMSDSLDKYGRGLLNQKNISDAQKFCPNFSTLSPDDKKEFWMHLFNGIAQNESKFRLGKPVFREPQNDNEAGFNIYSGSLNPETFSMGLFQLSYNSSNQARYQPGCSGISWKKDRNKRVEDDSLTIYDPKVQMDCAVTIMNRWVSSDARIGDAWNANRGAFEPHGGAKFWSTLRTRNGATQNVVASMHRFTPCGWTKGRK